MFKKSTNFADKKQTSLQRILKPFLANYGEYKARRMLVEKKYKIIKTKWKVKIGELDIVAVDGHDLVFVEVKTRKAAPYSGFPAADAVDYRKIKKVKSVAGFFLERHERLLKKLRITHIRYDVIGVTFHSLFKCEYEHRIDAFD